MLTSGPVARRIREQDAAIPWTVGLDPAAYPGNWCVYDFFPSSLRRDLQRFPTREQRRRWLADAGFERIDTAVVEQIRSAVKYDDGVVQAILARSFTSQLTELSDAGYAEGLARIRTAAAQTGSFTLIAEIDLHSTCGWKAV